MTTILIAPRRVAETPEAGGHFWVYMQYVLGLRDLGHRVYWLEALDRAETSAARRTAARFLRRMRSFDLDNQTILYSVSPDDAVVFHTHEASRSWRLITEADLLLNFDYLMPRPLLERVRRSALIDIDPGLLQFWMATGQLTVYPHDAYLTTGETVGTEQARFPDGGLSWKRVRPIVHLGSWPYVPSSRAAAFTTVSSWYAAEWVTDGKEVSFDNDKRVSFLRFERLPRLTQQPLELALALGGARQGAGQGRVTPRVVDPGGDGTGEAADISRLRSNGWRIRRAREVAGTPDRYRRYLQWSRGEFSAAKPSCMYFQNAWVSDRTICYLASGKPAVVQDTGPSSYLPSGRGMFRVQGTEDAAAALQSINGDYRSHCRAARDIAESLFAAERILPDVLDQALG
jgi:hypothetical protein